MTGFVDHMISIGNRLADLEQTAANAATTADLLGLEMPNMQTMLRCLCKPDLVIAVALLEDDASNAANAEQASTVLAYALQSGASRTLALEAARTAYRANGSCGRMSQRRWSAPAT